MACRGLGTGGAEGLVRDYIKNQGLGIGPEHLEVLVPAFDLAWKTVEQRGGFLFADGEVRAFKDRLAKAVVDQVMTGRGTNPEAVAAEAVKTVLAGRPSLA